MIQSLALAFVLSQGAAIAAPAVQATNLSPDQQVICLGNGGMKVVTFSADGTATEIESAHGLDCLLCGALQALPSKCYAEYGPQAMPFVKAEFISLISPIVFESRSPPARAPPLAA